MKFRLIVSFLVFTLTLFAQKAADGEIYFNNKQYAKARAVYEVLLKQKPNDALYNYRYALCSYELKDEEKAIEHFKMTGNKFPLRDLYLGELYYNTYRFDESVMAYQTYIATLKPDDSKLPEYQKKIKQAENAAKLITKVEDIAIVDSIVVNKTDFLHFYKFSSELGSLTQEPLKLNSRKTVDKIKYTTQRQDRIYYSDSIKGQMNIFTSYKLLDKWSDAVSVSNVINTPANENYPFLLLDGITLYFASDGENSIGGYDLFITRYTPATDSFLTPENIGMPFNSPFNDYMMVIDEQHKLGWFATDRYQPAGKVIIYTFVPNDAKIIVRTEDKDQLRQYAKLKAYRKLSVLHSDSSTVFEEQMQESEKLKQFIINDSVAYSNVSQFKSEEAKKDWTELHKMNAELKTKKTQLENLRLQFSDPTKEKERQNLTNSIMEAEKNYINLENQIQTKTTQIRNAEIQYLQKHK